ncbi:MAG: hypothetical protein JSV06_06655, partial [Myxococcales bacterium]
MRRTKVGLALLLLSAGCHGAAAAERIELGAPAEVVGVRRAERLTDDRRALNGAEWNSRQAALLDGHRAYVLFDLGEVTPIEAAYIQGDNNDQFVLEVSDDG